MGVKNIIKEIFYFRRVKMFENIRNPTIQGI